MIKNLNAYKYSLNGHQDGIINLTTVNGIKDGTLFSASQDGGIAGEHLHLLFNYFKFEI